MPYTRFKLTTASNNICLLQTINDWSQFVAIHLYHHHFRLQMIGLPKCGVNMKSMCVLHRTHNSGPPSDEHELQACKARETMTTNHVPVRIKSFRDEWHHTPVRDHSGHTVTVQWAALGLA